MSEPSKVAIVVGVAVWFVFMVFVAAVIGLLLLADGWPEWAQALMFFGIITFMLSACVGVVVWKSAQEGSDDNH